MLKNKTVLVTGGTGSLGQALVKALLETEARAVRVFSRNEYLQWQFRTRVNSPRVRWMVGDVREVDRLRACMRGADYVIHTAALKHVATGQYNPQEMIRTNILGSVNVVEAASVMGVQRVLGISSDKAIAPSCLYGSTKQIMETLFRDANRWASPMTRFSLLRPPNYFESHGNVFELWREQAKTGTITLTSDAMQRFFMPVEDCAKLALWLLTAMTGGEVFVPKCQEYSIRELAMDRHPHCEIAIIGKGDGEKDREVLFAQNEKPVDCGNYWVVK